MPQILRLMKGLTSWTRTQRTKLLVLLLVMALVAPQPAKGQFLPIDMAAIVSAIGAINTAITNVIGAGLRDISGALNAVNGVLNAIQSSSRTPFTRWTPSTAPVAWLAPCRVSTTPSGG